MARSQRGEQQRWGRARERKGGVGWPQQEGTAGARGPRTGQGDQDGQVGHEIRVGKPQVTPSKPSHVAGVREGNAPGSYKAQPGHLEDGTSTARRSTGINAKHRDPIDPSAPNLSPA
jgi:hypothetical protein